MPSPNLAFMTVAERPHPRTSIERIDVSGARSFLRLSLSNRTALDMPMGEIIADYLAAALGLTSDLRMSIACSVHEAVLNAVLHGNLAMANEGRGHWAESDEFSAAVERRLVEPALTVRRCEIRVRWTAGAVLVRVTDGGNGFRAAVAPDDAALPWGRGMRVIRALATRCRWIRGGRSLLMRFAR